jgi:hypothetical protein
MSMHGHNDEIRSHESIFMIMIFMHVHTQARHHSKLKVVLAFLGT